MGDASHSPISPNPGLVQEGIASSAGALPAYSRVQTTESTGGQQVPPDHYQQAAFASQFQMPPLQVAGGPFNMGHMAGSLPQANYRHVQQRYSGQPIVGQLSHVGQMGSGGGPHFYVPQHPQMVGYYAPLSPSQQQARMSSQQAYYPGQMVGMPNPQPMGSGYYFPPGGQHPGQNQIFGGQYAPLAGGQPHLAPQGPRDAENSGSALSPIEASKGPGDDRQGVVRGPPRKPKQNGHAIWIGNLPPQTDLMQLVHHVCRETKGLQSLFLISKSNCAFANFKDEETCVAAQQKLHDSKFQTVRLVSRLRKSTVEGAAGVTAPTGPAAAVSGSSGSSASQTPVDNPEAASQDGETGESTPAASTHPAPNAAGGDATSQKDRFFVLKSLTIEDLELSVRTGIWATQAHNEQALNTAFKTADVYLVFSANKSGEYFGYARMTSEINSDPAAAIEFAPKAQSSSDVDLPRAIPTDTTEFAPKGRIIDDSARGTIFWEAETDGVDEDGIVVDGANEDEESSSTKSDGEGQKAWGKPFKLEWLSTARLPFYRTRGLRNPWNSNREVKIARDGTELEPSVGRRLIGLFNRIQSPAPVGMRPIHGMAGTATGYPPPGHPSPAGGMRPAY